MLRFMFTLLKIITDLKPVALIKQVKRTPVERDTLYNVVKDYSETDFEKEKFDALLN